ncbi:hypothetical protein CEXT_347641, partial [Caerostris extrusa]
AQAVGELKTNFAPPFPCLESGKAGRSSVRRSTLSAAALRTAAVLPGGKGSAGMFLPPEIRKRYAGEDGRSRAKQKTKKLNFKILPESPPAPECTCPPSCWLPPFLQTPAQNCVPGSIGFGKNVRKELTKKTIRNGVICKGQATEERSLTWEKEFGSIVIHLLFGSIKPFLIVGSRSRRNHRPYAGQEGIKFHEKTDEGTLKSHLNDNVCSPQAIRHPFLPIWGSRLGGGGGTVLKEVVASFAIVFGNPRGIARVANPYSCVTRSGRRGE